MRTTIDLYDDLMHEVAGRAVAEGRSLKAVVNEALRLGLNRKSGSLERWTCPVYPLGDGRVDYTRAWELVDALEADAAAEKLERRQ